MRPVFHIEKLIKEISDQTQHRSCGPRTVIPTHRNQEPLTVLIHQGVVGLVRSSDGLLMGNVIAPSIIGVNLINDNVKNMIVKARTNVIYETVSQSDFEKVIREKSLWESVAYVVMQGNRRLVENHLLLTGVSSYTAIKNSLLQLIDEPDDVRYLVTACDYIQDRTLLSRSAVMKVLSQLKHGGYIELKRGILLAINKLPEKY